MSHLSINDNWLHELRASAAQPPSPTRQPLWAGASLIGSVEADFLSQIDLSRLFNGREQLLKEERFGVVGWCLHGDTTTGLNQLAAAMRAAGLAGVWRSEQLAVLDETGQRVGTIERAAVRPLGITTLAVHLVGQTPDGHFWVEQRAFDKANDPGLWDTLMGGMVSANDTTETALQRETWEEAGLYIDELHHLSWGGRLSVSHPCSDGNGAGYVQEHIDWYRCTVPDGLTPENQDGEVEQFCLMESEQLLQAMQRGEFTLEATLIFAEIMNLP